MAQFPIAIQLIQTQIATVQQALGVLFGNLTVQKDALVATQSDIQKHSDALDDLQAALIVLGGNQP